MNGVEELIFSVVELAGGIGVSTVISEAATKATPTNLKTAEKICVGIGSGMATVAANEIISRECRNVYKDMKHNIRIIKKNIKKAQHKKSYRKHDDRKEEKK